MRAGFSLLMAFFSSLMAVFSRSWLLFLAHGCSFSRSWLPRARQIGFMQAIKGCGRGIQCTVIHHDIVCPATTLLARHLRVHDCLYPACRPLVALCRARNLHAL